MGGGCECGVVWVCGCGVVWVWGCVGVGLCGSGLCLCVCVGDHAKHFLTLLYLPVK